MRQLTIDMPADTSTLYPTARRLRLGDDIEGYGGRAVPRRLHVVGLETVDNETRIIYTEKVGTQTQYGVLHLPADTPVDIAPPF